MTYGCKDRTPLETSVLVQDGWIYEDHTRKPLMVVYPDPMTKDCQYQAESHDPQCVGCKHKETMHGSRLAPLR